MQLGSGESRNVKHAVPELPSFLVERLYLYTSLLMKVTTYPLTPTDSLCCAPFIVLDIVTLAGRALHLPHIPLHTYSQFYIYRTQ